LGNIDESREYFEKRLKYEFNLYSIENLCYIAIKQGNFEKAFDYYQILKEHNYEENYIIQLMICKELNIFFKDELYLNNYGNAQAISYDEFEAIEYILDRHSKDFDENIDIVKLFVNIKQFLTKENQVNMFSTSDIYDIPYEGLSNETNNIRVLTLPNTKNIVNMYPILKK
jgi:tetratricopeptide (TPR) repeat protein